MIMALCACSTSAADEENKPDETTKTEETETKVEETVEDVEINDSEKDSSSNSDELTEAKLEELYNSICKLIITDYCEPNNILSKDFVWPETSSIAWMYFGELVSYHNIAIMGVDVEFTPTNVPSESEKELMDTTFFAILECIDTNCVDDTTWNSYYSYILKDLNPYNEKIPEKLVVSEFKDDVSETETITEETDDSSSS